MKKTRKKTFLLLLFIFCFSGIWFLCPQQACAKVIKGTCRENVRWTYNARTKVLDLSGKGTVTEPFYKVLKRVPKKFRKKYLSLMSLDWDNIDTINIGAEIRFIHGVFFWNQYKLKTICVDSANPNYTVKDGVLFSKDLSTLVFYPQTKEDKEYTIPSTVKHIGDLAFACNPYITEVVCPTGLLEMGSGAFYGCTKLKNINISELTLLKEITDYHTPVDIFRFASDDDGYGAGVFRHIDGYGYEENLSFDSSCMGTFEGTDLQTFIMPNNLQSIANDTFRCCYNLHKFYIGKEFTGEPAVGDTTPEDTFSQTALPFYYMDLKKLYIHPQNPKYILKDNILYTRDMSTICRVFDNQDDMIYDIIDGTLRIIPNKNIILDKRIKYIANGAFYNCKTIKTVKSNVGLAEIGAAAFADSSVEVVEVKDGIQKIDTGAFLSSDIKFLSCNGPIHRISNQAFDGCIMLQGIKCAAIQEIGKGAFVFCYALHTVDCASIYKTGTSAFVFCTNLRYIPQPEHSEEDSFERCKQLNLNNPTKPTASITVESPFTATVTKAPSTISHIWANFRWRISGKKSNTTD